MPFRLDGRDQEGSRGRPHAVPVSMAGIKRGDQVLQIGCRDPGMLAALALQVGLSGQGVRPWQ